MSVADAATRPVAESERPVLPPPGVPGPLDDAAIPEMDYASYRRWENLHIYLWLHNLAVLLWITANSIWMIGEFYFNDGTRPVAGVFFAAGILLLTGYYGSRLLRRRLRS